MSSHLLMWIEAPLQSWSFDSRFSKRDTINFPTKSGIFGLLLCALGAQGEQKELLSRMADLKMTVLAFSRMGKKQPLLEDFHMVGAGYKDTAFEELMIPKTSEGKKAVNGGVKLTYRHYLQDKAFAVILEAPEDLIELFSNALVNPVWDLYFGRKNCVPTDIIYRGSYLNDTEAESIALDIAKAKSYALDFKVVEGQKIGEVLVLNDVPIQFGIQKLYRQRFITVIYNYDR